MDVGGAATGRSIVAAWRGGWGSCGTGGAVGVLVTHPAASAEARRKASRQAPGTGGTGRAVILPVFMGRSVETPLAVVPVKSFMANLAFGLDSLELIVIFAARVTKVVDAYNDPEGVASRNSRGVRPVLLRRERPGRRMIRG